MSEINYRGELKGNEAKHFALIGRGLSHSLSAKYFAETIGVRNNADYKLLELTDMQSLMEMVEQLHLAGFNVTSPYKIDVMSWLGEMDDVAKEVGAVNAVRVDYRDDKPYLFGTNTDAQAFSDLLSELHLGCGSTALVLGTGGAARAAAWALWRCGVEYALVSRHPSPGVSIGYDEAVEMIGCTSLLVNATPVGMEDKDTMSPWTAWNEVDEGHVVVDFIYEPRQTVFLREASSRGAVTVNGYSIFCRQALLSYRFWGLVFDEETKGNGYQQCDDWR